MFKMVEKIGGRKVVVMVLSCLMLLAGFFLMQKNLECYKVYCGSVVAICSAFIVGNSIEHKYNSGPPENLSK